MAESNQLSPDLIQFIKLIAVKRDGIAMGRQYSDDKQFSFSVFESLVGFGNADVNTMVLVRNSNGEIIIRKNLLEKSELSVFFWLIFANLRKNYLVSTECDAAAWKVLVDNYGAITKRKIFSEFYEEYNKFLCSFITPDKVETKFEQYVLERSLLMQELVLDKVMSMD